MAICGTCARELAADPNELEEIVACKFCDSVFCSEDCAAEHDETVHLAETVPAAAEEEERR